MGYRVAVVGATGNVGREMLNILAEREFPADEVFAIASRRSMGVEVSFGDKRLKCLDLEQLDFRGVDFALMSAGSAVAKDWAPRIGAQGCIVIDNSSYWRYDPDVPLIVPEMGTYVDDIIEGEYKEYHKNGLPKFEATYINGEIEGKKNSYYDNGAFQKVENYYKGKLDSYVRIYYPNGFIQREEYYKDGKLVRSKDFNEEGYMVSTFGY